MDVIKEFANNFLMTNIYICSCFLLPPHQKQYWFKRFMAKNYHVQRIEQSTLQNIAVEAIIIFIFEYSLPSSRVYSDSIVPFENIFFG